MIEVKLAFTTFAEAAAFFAGTGGIPGAANAIPISHAPQMLTGTAAPIADIPAEVVKAAEPKKPRAKKAEAEKADAAPAAVEPAQESTAPIRVADFGAKGDGVTDDTAAIQAAVDAAVSDNSYTVDDVRQALRAYSGREGFPAATELVKSFGATRITELKAEDYAAFIAKTEEKVAA